MFHSTPGTHAAGFTEAEAAPTSSHLSFSQLLETESVASLLGMVTSGDPQSQLSAAVALGHLAMDRDTHTEVRAWVAQPPSLDRALL